MNVRGTTATAAGTVRREAPEGNEGRVSLRRLNLLVWFGVLGGALAWILQEAFGYMFGNARCDSASGRFIIPFHAWSLGMAVAAVAIALAAEAVAFIVFRRTREAERLELKRIHFLSITALTINPLVLAISAMTAVGTSILALCHQS